MKRSGERERTPKGKRVHGASAELKKCFCSWRKERQEMGGRTGNHDEEPDHIGRYHV